MTDKPVPTIFSPHRRQRRLARSEVFARRGECADWLARDMAEDAAERISFMRLEPQRALVIGPMAQSAAQGLPKAVLRTSRDDEAPVECGPYDLIVSLGQLDTVNDLPGALLHLRNALAPGGVIIASVVGAGSLPMLRQIMLAADGERPAPRIHPQIDSRAATGLLERAGFARQVVDSTRLAVAYRSLGRMVADLREQGLTSILANPSPPLGKAALARARDAFAALADDTGRVTETFVILTLTGWR